MWTTTSISWATIAPMPSLPCCTGIGTGKRFRLATRDAGAYFDSDHVGRGAAFGDLDDDGDIDIVVNHKDGRTGPACATTPGPGITGSGCPGRHDQQPRRCRGAGRGRIDRPHARPTTKRGHEPRKFERSPAPDRSRGGNRARKVTVRWPSGQVGVAERLAADTSYRVVEPRRRGGDAAGTSFEVIREMTPTRRIETNE